MGNRCIIRATRLVLLVCLYCFTLPLWAAPTTVLTDAQTSVSVNTHLDFLHDPAGNLSIEDVAAPAYAAQFHNTGAADFSKGLTTDVYWLRVRILNQANAAHPWFLQLIGQEDASVAVYLQADLPSLATPPTRLEPQPYFLYHTYPLPLASQTAYTLYIRLHNENAALLGNAHFKQAEQRVNIHSVVFGVLLAGCLLALGVYNGILAFNLRDRNFAWLAVFILAIMLKLTQYTGLFQQYIRVSEQYAFLYSALGYLCIISYLAFFRHLLGTRSYLPYLDKVFAGIFWLAVVMMLGSPWLPFDLYVINVLALLSGVITLLTIWRLRRLQIPRIHKLNWAFFVLIGGLLPTVLNTLGISLGFNDHLNLSLTGVTLFVLLLSTVQADHVRRLREETTSANAANKAKGDFLTTMSHELRTPMNAVVGAGVLLQDTALTPQQRSYVDKLEIAARHMLTLIGNILDVARIEQQALHLEKISFDLNAIATELEILFARQAVDKGLAFNIHAPADSVWLQGDPTRLKQILVNLLGNAIKFTERGSVECTLVVGKKSEEGLPVTFSVTDSGIGITLQQQVHLFQPFSQADSSTSRRYGGSGLGLAISAQLVRQMGGELSVGSLPGQGSSFSFTLEFPVVEIIPAVQSPASIAPRTLPDAHILLVDDDVLNQFFAQAILEKLGMRVTVADSGAAAIQQAQQQDFAMVLMDVSMPGMDGYETTRQIRQFKPAAALPIIALTAHAIEGEWERCFAAGMDDFLSKPYQLRDLQQILQRWLR